MPRTLSLALGLACVLAAVPAAAQDADADGIAIHDAWARASLGNAPNSVAYMTLEVTGEEGDRLTSASSPLVERVELHASVMEGDVARMRPVDAAEVTPGAPTVLEPGGLHLMLIGLKQRLEEGQTLPLELSFAKAGTIDLEVPVLGLGARGPDAGHAGH